MKTPADVMARSLVDELERRGRGRVTFANPGTRDTLIREFKDRLDRAPNPGSDVWAGVVPVRAK